MNAFVDALLLRGGYNTTSVVLGTALLGVAGGIVGSFALLRRRSLLADALGHATLPGVCVAFLFAPFLGASARSLPILLAGATLAAVIATLLVQAILRWTRLSEDAAIGAVLSVLFGVGVVLLSVIQTLPSGNAGGLKSFLFGQTAALQRSDAMLLGGLALLAIGASALFLKELALVAFDESFARASGIRADAMDVLLLGLIVAVTVAGLQAVGLVLVVAILITPAVAARLWTDRVNRFIPLAALIGGASGWIGASLSALAPRQPAGALIVLTATGLFTVSLLIAPRGLLPALVRRVRLRAAIAIDHVTKVLLVRPQTPGELAASIGHGTLPTTILCRWLGLRGLLRRTEARWSLTERGRAEGERVARNHRLWSAYLVRFAVAAPDHVDPSAEAIEHVLGAEFVAELENQLQREPDLGAAIASFGAAIDRDAGAPS